MSEYKKGDYKDYFYADDNVVFGFFKEFRYLSNFYKCHVMWNGEIWPSSEHAYQAAKCNFHILAANDMINYKKICSMSCPEVKKWGQQVKLREDWEQIKLSVMTQINIDKYIRNFDLREKLIETGHKNLIEANNWRDEFWGYDVKTDSGKNNLGKILMMIRDQLKN